MSDGIELTLSVAKPVVIAGESLPVVVTVRNHGDAAVSLRTIPTSPVRYELTSQASPEVRFDRSPAEGLAIAVGDARIPHGGGDPESIAPGQSHVIEDDPAACHREVLPPGAYSLRAHCPVGDATFTSNEVLVSVRRPEIGVLTDAYCVLSGAQAQAFDHRDEDGRVWAFVRDTKDERAEIEAFRRVAEIPGEGLVQGLSIGVHTELRLTGRWLGWLRGDSVGACHSWGVTVTSRLAPVPVTLTRPVLVGSGFQRASQAPARTRFRFGDALFLVAGEWQGGVVLQPFLATAGGIVPGEISPLCDRSPLRIVARCTPEEGRIDVVWAETTGASTTVFGRPYDASGQPLSSSAVPLYERRSPLIALEMYPVHTRGTPPAIHALFGPESDEGRAPDLVYARIPFGTDGAPAHFAVPAPMAQIDGYAISALRAGGLLTLAGKGREIWYTSAERDPQWRRLHRTLGPVVGRGPVVGSLRAAASSGLYWAALAVDPALGVVCVVDPAYSREADA